MKITKSIPLLALLILSSGCSSLTRVDHVPIKKEGEKRDLVIFFDGTANDEGSHTNVAKLHNLVTLQNKTNISTSYIKGVGTDSKVIGMMMGWGIGNDVREGYSYLLENYDSTQGDEISLFGFSRGAYASRILAALLNVAGIPNTDNLTNKERRELVKDIYDAFKCRPQIKEKKNTLLEVKNNKDSHNASNCSSDNQYTVEQRREHVKSVISLKWKNKISYTPSAVNVRFIGLWDTVGALGIPDYEENIDEPNERYADQLCNINFAAHALSLDDDRARIFTPLLLTRQHLRDECKSNNKTKDLVEDVNYTAKVNEVWFSGAHSDVGGGYSDTEINGVSLNWMLDEMEKRELNIVPRSTEVYSDYLGKTHDPEAGLFGLIYKKQNRAISCYTDRKNTKEDKCMSAPDKKGYADGSTDESEKLRIHQSVLDRLCVKTPENHESFWFKQDKYKNCLTCDSSGYGMLNSLNPQCNKNIEVISSKRYKRREGKLGDITCNYDACPKANGYAYQKDKSCNFDHQKVKLRAKQRLSSEKITSSKKIIVYADVKNDRTGIYLSKDKFYTFKINENYTWVDCDTTVATPFNGRPTWAKGQTIGKNLINIFGKTIAYAPFNGYMELLGVVAEQQFELGKLAQTGSKFSPNEDGELILRVNEPRFMKQVYENNSGVLELTITSK